MEFIKAKEIGHKLFLYSPDAGYAKQEEVFLIPVFGKQQMMIITKSMEDKRIVFNRKSMGTKFRKILNVETKAAGQLIVGKRVELVKKIPEKGRIL